MKKLKGITVCCPACKKILLRYAVIKGDGTFEIKCTHCKELILVSMGQESWITANKVKVLIILLVLAVSIQCVVIFKLKNVISALVTEYTHEINPGN